MISFFIFLFGSISAIFEGLSFSGLLFGFSFLTKEISEERKILSLFEKWDPYTLFLFAVLIAIFFQILKSLFAYLGQLMSSFITINLQQKTQEKIYTQIFSLSYSSAATYKMGDLINYTSLPTHFFSPVMDAIHKVIVSALMIISYLSFMLFLSPSLTLIILLLFMISSFFQKKLIQKIVKSSKEQSLHVVKLSEDTAQNFEGLKLIHLFHRQEKILKKIKSALLQVSSSTFKLNKWSHLIVPINEMIGIFLAGASLLLGFLFLKNQTSFPLVSMLLTFLTLTYRLGSRLQFFLGTIGTIVYNWGSMGRIQEILKNEGKEFIPNKRKRCPPFNRRIDLENISFSYTSKKRFAIKNLTLTLEKGKTIAIVGSSGSGKSTLFDLLLRLYEPNKGQILLDGKNVSEYELGSWRSLFGVVSQDAFLFHDSIKENIRFGNLDARNEKIIESAKLANAHEFISELPDGYQTIIGERGYKLSGGEKQRISLARALIRNPEILILDEATSHLDSQSEFYIQKSLEKLRGKKTLIVVAHRLSTIALADEIYVLENGSLIEKGTHQDLLSLGGRYHMFWNIQSREKSYKRSLI